MAIFLSYWCMIFVFTVRNSASFNMKSRSLIYLRQADLISTNKNAISMKADSQLLSSIALVSGTTVGAGMLALPITASQAGFIPSTLALMLSWVVMCTTGLLIAESSCNLQKLPNETVLSIQNNVVREEIPAAVNGIVSITSKVFGDKASFISSLVYAINNYVLLTAYIAQSGTILDDIFHLPSTIGPVIYAVGLGLFMSISSQKSIENLNNFVFVLLIITFAMLLSIGYQIVDVSNLSFSNYEMIWQTIPVMLVALVYHNIVPTVCSQMNYDKKQIMLSIIIGSLIPLLMFISWDAVILGIGADRTPIDAAHIQYASDSSIPSNSKIDTASFDPVNVLNRYHPGYSWLDTRTLVNVFGLSAITTSFIGFSISLSDFFCEIFNKLRSNINAPSNSPTDKLALNLLSIGPPLAVAVSDPSLFLKALDYAGTYGVSFLCGILPVGLALGLRRKFSQSMIVNRANFNVISEADSATIYYDNFVPGGDTTLWIFLVSIISAIAIKVSES